MENLSKWIIRLIITAIICATIYYLRSVIMPFVVGWLLAYLLHPLVNFYQTKCKLKYKSLSLAATILTVLAAIGLFIAILIPSITAQVHRADSLIHFYLDNHHSFEFIPLELRKGIEEFLSKIELINILTFDNIEGTLQSLSPSFMKFFNQTMQIFAGFFVVIITILYTIFILMDYEKLSYGVIKLTPIRYRNNVKKFIVDLSNAMGSYFKGQYTIAFIVGILYAIGFTIIGLPMGIIMGITIGILHIIPYMQTVGFIPVFFLALLKVAGTDMTIWKILLGVAIVFIIIQTINDLVLVPKIMGKAMGLNPAIIIFSLAIWGSILGVFGMIIALPMTTLMISYYYRYVVHRKTSDKQTITNKEEIIKS